MALSARWMSRATSDVRKAEWGRSMARSRCSWRMAKAAPKSFTSSDAWGRYWRNRAAMVFSFHPHVDPGPVFASSLPGSTRQGAGVAVAEGVVHGEIAPVNAQAEFGLVGQVACVQEAYADVEHPVPVLVAADFVHRFLDAVNLTGVLAAVGVGLEDECFRRPIPRLRR